MKFSLSQLAFAVGVSWHEPDITIHHIGIDSRKLAKHSLFVAVKGEQFDGHDFIQAAEAAGACALMVERPVDSHLPQIIVPDTIQALGLLALLHRQNCDIPVIGVTGSCGKTTTKTLIASILKEAGRVLATAGTLNNHIGVPLTLFGLSPKDDFAVIEMGANHLGEIAYLSQIAKPNIGVITNAAAVHLEGFGSLEGVAQGKGELYQHLSVDGIAILNYDDPQQSYWRTIIGARAYLTFGYNHCADIRASNVQLDAEGQPHFTLHHGGETIDIHLPLLGIHNVPNALAAAAVGFSLGLPIKTIRKGLQKTNSVAKRGHRLVGLQGATLIDDSYNANPTAFKAAIDLLCRFPGERMIVMGDMAELGPQASELHAEVGQYAKQASVDHLFTVGPLSAHASQAFGEGAHHFDDQASLIASLKEKLHANSTWLIKGSKSSHMGTIVDALHNPIST